MRSLSPVLSVPISQNPSSPPLPYSEEPPFILSFLTPRHRELRRLTVASSVSETTMTTTTTTFTTPPTATASLNVPSACAATTNQSVQLASGSALALEHISAATSLPPLRPRTATPSRSSLAYERVIASPPSSTATSSAARASHQTARVRAQVRPPRPHPSLFWHEDQESDQEGTVFSYSDLPPLHLEAWDSFNDFPPVGHQDIKNSRLDSEASVL